MTCVQEGVVLLRKWGRNFVKYLVIPMSLLGIAFFYQNCSGGFKTDEMMNTQQLLQQSTSAALSVPQIEIVSAPSNISNSKNISIQLKTSLDSRTQIKSLTCQLNNNTVVDCSNQVFTANNLADGDYTLRLSLEDSAGQKAPEKIVLFRIDATAPTVSVSSAPPSVSGNNSATFVFVASDLFSGVKDIECALDNLAYAICTSPFLISNLTTGAHSFKIRARDLAGNMSLVSNVMWTVDLSAPSLTLSAQPSAITNIQTASFSFSGTSAGAPLASYECSLDGGAYSVCTSPQNYNALADGVHNFSVRGKNSAGTVSSPVNATWKVDTAVPSTPTMTANTKSPTQLKSISIALASTDAGSNISGYQCSLDNVAFANCTSPVVYTNLNDSAHSLRVKSKDGAGNESAIGTFNWTVDTVVPNISLTSMPPASTSEQSATFVFTATDSGSNVMALECMIDSSAYTACTSPKVYAGLSVGNHQFQVRATDGAGNIKTQSYSWSVIMMQNLDGAALYTANCAACHGALNVSAKMGRSAAQIQTAMSTITNMNFLKLSAAEVDAIAKVLKVESGLTQKYTCTDPSVRGKADNKFRRLTKPEIVNTLTDLVGSNVMSDSNIKTQLGLLTDDLLLGAPTDIPEAPPHSQMSAMLEISNRIAEIAFTTTSVRDQIFGTCAGQAAITATCVQNFISNFGLKAFRRPVTSSESANLIAQFNLVGGIEGLKQTLMRILLAPPLTYHVEIGTMTTAGRTRLTDYEVASRISYRLTGSMPDATLLQAAASGQLATVSDVKTQAQRLMTAANAKAKNRVSDFFRYYLQTHDIVADPYVGAGNIAGVNTVGLGSELKTELSDFVDNVIWNKQGKFKDLLTSTEVLPKTSRVAKILETTVATGSTPVQTNTAHAGLLLRPALLMHPGNLTKPYHRAAIVRKRVLCEIFGAPDPNAVSARQTELGDLSQLSNRDRLTQMTNIPACMGCHAKLNPVAFVLEGYDQLGMRRSAETLFNSSHTATGTLPINTQVDAPQIEDVSGPVTSMRDALDLVNAIASGSTAKSCFAQTVFEYQRARSSASEDACALSEVETTAKDESVAAVFINSVANEDIFWKGVGN